MADEPSVAEIPADQPVEAPAFSAHTETPTLLQNTEVVESAPETPVEVPVETPVLEVAPEPVSEGEAKPVDPVEVKPEEPIVYQAFELPENVALDEKTLGEFTGLAQKFKLPQETAQEILAFGAQAVKAFQENSLAQQHQAFGDMRRSWRDQVMADPEIGGAGHRTAMAAIARMRDLAVPEKDRAAFNEFLVTTGAGDHPAFLRMVHNFARFFDEPAPVVGRPPANQGKPGLGAHVLYDHPRSNINR